MQQLFDSEAYPDLLIGLGAADDAAVYRLNDGQAVIVTTDFFTPIVDDPYDFGAIAAANALSDVYAMGGDPILALNIAAMPPELDPEIISEIFRGGAEKVREAGAAIAGGHTIQDKEPKYGLVAIGLGHPEALITKGGARPGDILILSKPLGSGVISTAIKRGLAAPEHAATMIETLMQLNAAASQIGRAMGVRGGTDITGFGLLGHALEVAQASRARLRFRMSQIPLLPGAAEYAASWTFPGGAHNNRRFYGPHVTFAPGISEEAQMLLFDPQTSGGLLLSIPPDRVDQFQHRCEARSQPIWLIGEVVEGEGIEVLP